MAQAGVFELRAVQIFSQEDGLLRDLKQPVEHLWRTRLDTLVLTITGVNPGLYGVD